MTYSYIPVGIGLVICGVIIALLLHKRKKAPQTSNSSQTSVPRQTSTAAQKAPPALPGRRRKTGSATMPQRRSFAAPNQAARMANSRASVQNGPHGVKPEQFPWCPVCGKHNETGANQVIFWFPDEKIYKCSGGHKMAGNGKLIC
ncbi:hypothetical protein [Ruminococcus sp. 5_1_39BFAA]|uniref:hypothetical protein n=1 Tax=Ruminococcus sp. 5_1_39BFAA TaxID=457412 RepID=UPI0035683397